MGRAKTAVKSSSSSSSMMISPANAVTTRYRIPTIVRILSELLHGFMVLFLQRGDLSYSAFCNHWKDEDMPSLHTLCPERINYAAYIQILYYLLLETQLFLDFSATVRIPSLETIPFQEIRCLVSLVPVIYSLFTLYQTAPATSSTRFIPIRITTSKFQDLAMGVRSVIELVDGVGHDIAALWGHLTGGTDPSDSSSTSIALSSLPSPSAFEEAAYTGPISTFFLEQQRILQLQRLSTVSPELPWNNIDDWRRAVSSFEAEKIQQWIFGAFIDSDAPYRAKEAIAVTITVTAANDGSSNTSDSDNGNNDDEDDDIRALVLQPNRSNKRASGDQDDDGNGGGDDDDDNDEDDAIATVAGYIAMRLQHMRLQIHTRRQQRRDDIARRQHERLTRLQERQQRSQQALRQRVYAYEVAQRRHYAEAQRDALERARHAQQQLALQQAQLQLHQQQQLQQQQQQQQSLLSPSPAMLGVAAYEHAPFDSAAAAAATAPTTARGSGRAKTATVAGKKRARQAASSNALDTQRITRLLDDLEAQIAAVTQQYEGYDTAALATDEDFNDGAGSEMVEDSDSEEDDGAMRGYANVAVSAPRAQRSPHTSTVPRRTRPATSRTVSRSTPPPQGSGVLSHGSDEHDTLAELEALIASVESQYTSRGRRRTTRPTAASSSGAAAPPPPTRQRRTVRAGAPTRRRTPTVPSTVPDIPTSEPASNVSRVDTAGDAAVEPALGVDHGAAAASVDLAAMLAELEGLTAAVLKHTAL